ncbi:MAG: DUF2490 domain-containing protein [Candidatus Omnitrophica bacterium]|nr:DUF2490 domain-containing protein [Candidatus Omnitrophota bacterium]
MKRICRIIVFIFFVFFFTCIQNLYAKGDLQYWNTATLEWKAKKDWKLSFEEEFRLAEELTTFSYKHSDLGLSYSGMADWLEIKISYRQIFNISHDRWKYENVPNLNITAKADFFGINLTDRNRMEYRDIEDKKSDWRYRNKFTAILPKLTRLGIEPYAADEIFIDCTEDFEFNRNRLYAGITFALIKNLKLDLYYLLQTTKSGGKWVSYNVFGTKAKLSF